MPQAHCRDVDTEKIVQPLSTTFPQGEWGNDSMDNFSRAQFYRAETKRLRKKMAVLDLPEIRQGLADLAVRHAFLAEDLEASARRSRPGGTPQRQG